MPNEAKTYQEYHYQHWNDLALLDYVVHYTEHVEQTNYVGFKNSRHRKDTEADSFNSDSNSLRPLDISFSRNVGINLFLQ